MDRQLLERMIGASVLLVVLVLVAPAILDGQRDNGIAPYSDGGTGSHNSRAEATAPRLRTHTIVLDREPDGPPVARPLNEESVPAAAESIIESSPESNNETQKSVSQAPVSQAAVKSVKEPVAVKKTVVEKTPVKPTSGWSVQLGSFAERPNAERLAGEVGSRGFTAYLEPLTQSGRTFYRVRVGPRNTRDQAAELASGLAKAGYTGQVIQQQPAP
jgi:DedD protein